MQVQHGLGLTTDSSSALVQNLRPPTPKHNTESKSQIARITCTGLDQSKLVLRAIRSFPSRIYGVLCQNLENLTGGAESGPSERAFRASEDGDLEVVLADSERAGQEAAPPITTAPASIEPLGGRFQAGFFPRAASDEDGATSSTGGLWGDRSKASGKGIAAAVGGDGVEEGEDGASGSPGTRCERGWRPGRAARGEGVLDKGSEAAAALEEAMRYGEEEGWNWVVFVPKIPRRRARPREGILPFTQSNVHLPCLSLLEILLYRAQNQPNHFFATFFFITIILNHINIGHTFVEYLSILKIFLLIISLHTTVNNILVLMSPRYLHVKCSNKSNILEEIDYRKIISNIIYIYIHFYFWLSI